MTTRPRANTPRLSAMMDGTDHSPSHIVARPLLIFSALLRLQAWQDSWAKRMAKMSGSLGAARERTSSSASNDMPNNQWHMLSDVTSIRQRQAAPRQPSHRPSFGATSSRNSTERGAIRQSASWLNGGAPLPRTLQSWRRELGLAVEQSSVQACMCTLILVDSLVVFAECVLDAMIDGKAVEASHETMRNNPMLRAAVLLDGGLKWLGYFFLWFFVLELAVLVFAFGGRFFRHPLYVFDLACVALTVCADFYVSALGTRGQHAFELLLRVWRVLRVAHGVYATMEAKCAVLEHQLEAAREESFILRNRLRRMEDTLATADPVLYGARAESLDLD